MTPPLPALRDFSDRLSPMVVKEMRQGLRTHFFTATLILFHLVLGCVVLSQLLRSNLGMTREMFWQVILVTLLGVLPLRAFNTLYHEIKDGTLDMLTLTGITSFRLVWGKWASLYSQTLLLASSLLPYMIVRYVLGGMEIAREALALLAAVAGSGLVTAAVTGFSSQKLMLVRGLMTAAAMAMACLIGLFAFVLSCDEYEGQAMMAGLVTLGVLKSTLFCLGIAALAACLGYLFLCLGSARLPLIADSQRVIKRTVIPAVMGMLVIGAAVIAFMRLSHDYVIILTFFPSLMILVLFSMDLATEETPVGAESEVHWFRRSGWPSGILFISVLWLAPFMILLAYESLVAGTWRHRELVPWLYTLGFMAASVAPACLPLFRRHSRLAQWWVVQILMIAVCVAYMIAMRVLPTDDCILYSYASLLTPMSNLVSTGGGPYENREELLDLGFFTQGTWIALAMILAVRSLLQERQNRLQQTPS